MSTAPADFVTRLLSLPGGTFHGTIDGRRYVVTKTAFAGDKSVKLVAEELGGSDYISLNLYRLQRGARLYPCEMPAAKVIAFVAGLVPDQDAG